MSYLDELTLGIDPSSLLYGDFGDLKALGQGQRFDGEFIYDLSENIFDQYTSGGATIAHQANPRDALMSIVNTTNGTEATIASYPVPYTAGNGQEILLTGVFDFANIGGGTFSLFRRTKTSGSVVEEEVEQADWNKNTYDAIDPQYTQIMGFSFQSLKVGTVKFIAEVDGAPTLLHVMKNDNKMNTGYWQLPHHEVTWKIYNIAGEQRMEMIYGDDDNAIGFRYTLATPSASATMKAICATVKSRGGQDLFDLPAFDRVAETGTATKTVSTLEVPILAMRARSTFNSLPNKGLIIPRSIEIETDNPIYLRAYINEGVLLGAWNNVDTNESIAEQNTTMTGFSGTGTQVYGAPVSTSKNVTIGKNSQLGRAPIWDRKSSKTGILVITGIRTGTSNANVLCSVNFGEIR